MADFAPSRAAQERDFADREGREVVMEHEALPLLALEALDFLRVFRGAQRTGDQRLGFAAREDCRSVRARQHARLDPDRPDLVELAAVEAHAVGQDLLAQNPFLEILKDLLRFDPALDFAFGDRRDELVEHLIDAVVVLELAADPHRFGQRHEDLLFDLAVEVVTDLLLLDLDLWLARLFREVVDGGDDLLDRRVRRFERFEDLLFGDFFRAGLDHHDAVAGAGDDEIDFARLALLEGRVDHVAAVDETDADAGDGPLERNVG